MQAGIGLAAAAALSTLNLRKENTLTDATNKTAAALCSNMRRIAVR
jgi:hypothetical protein